MRIITNLNQQRCTACRRLRQHREEGKYVWQILPTTLRALLDNTEPEAADRVLTALHAMTKIDIQALLDARDRRAG